jgi:tetratricopeptide (TPR) repeat protein
MNVTDSNPVLAIYLFKKAVEINPRKTTISNITAIAYQSGNYDLAILVFNDLLKKYPDNLEIFYNRAAVLGNKGEYLKCILDFYFIVDNTQFSNDAEAFFKTSNCNRYCIVQKLILEMNRYQNLYQLLLTRKS